MERTGREAIYETSVDFTVLNTIKMIEATKTTNNSAMLRQPSETNHSSSASTNSAWRRRDWRRLFHAAFLRRS